VIHVDHGPGNPPTVAEPPHFGTHAQAKLARDLKGGDVLLHDFRGFGQLFMTVRVVDVFADEGRVDVELTGPALQAVDSFDQDKTVLVFNPRLAGTWR
jgi:hypothetical protein